MGVFSTAEAQLPALMVESLFYGAYLITFVACLQRLLWDNGNWKRGRDINVTMICVVLLLFVSSSLNLALALVRDMQGFVYNFGSTTIDQVGQSWLNITKPATVVFQAILADSVLVYRCWLIWNKSFHIILIPLICWLGGVACGTFSIYLQVILQSGSRMNAGNIFWVVAAFWFCTILINMYSTSMIVWKIWRAEKAWRPPSICSIRDIPQRGRLQFAKRIIIESGLMYTVTTIIVFITHICRSNALFITSAAEIQITGIAFNLILTRDADRHSQRSDTLPVYRVNVSVASERLDRPSTLDVAVMANANHGPSCDKL